jgi:hypothetical protein
MTPHDPETDPSRAPAATRLPVNPFATRHTRPGVLPPLAADGMPRDVAALAAEILRHGGAGIEGPHGSGKSTLLAALVDELEAAGRLAKAARLDRQATGTALAAILGAFPGQAVCLDGWDMLHRPAAAGVRLVARRRGVVLVVTSHRPVGLPVRIPTATSVAILEAVVGHLPDHGGLITAADLAEAFADHRGNLREALLDLYDRFEERARRQRS